MASKIIGAFWFNSFMGNIGIVIVEDQVTKERKAYAGNAEPATTEGFDANQIRERGARVSLIQLKEIVQLMEAKSP
jgi:hypothetical protein